MDTKNILQQADELVNGDRREDYGHPLDDFSLTAKLWSGILGVGVTPQQIALCMICVKLSREVHKPKRDNRVDIAGYALTLDVVDQEIARRHAADEELTQTFSPLNLLAPGMTTKKLDEHIKRIMTEVYNADKITL